MASHDLVEKIRARLAELLLGAIDLDTFYGWFSGATWDCEGSESVRLLTLRGRIELAVAEYSAGLWEKDEFERELIEAWQGSSPVETLELDARLGTAEFQPSSSSGPSRSTFSEFFAAVPAGELVR
jgi:hypothetical protein